MAGENSASLPSSPGTYLLLMRLAAGSELVIGALGRHALPAGYYLYVGSALGGLRGRLRRHLRLEKRIRWHVDYLLQAASLEAILYCCSERRLECRWAQALARLPGLMPSEMAFGASDCDCHTHLFGSQSRPEVALLHRALVCPSDRLSVFYPSQG